MKKKLFRPFLTAVISLALMLGGAVGVLAAEEINDAKGLKEIAADPGGDYTLKGNITIKEEDNFTPIEDFSGTFNGNNNIITFETDISLKDEDGNAGLFANLNGATINDLTIRGCNLSGSKYVGALAGWANSAKITNCHVDHGTIIGNRGGYSVGGLLGYGTGVTISQCSSTAVVKANDGDSYAGGLVGLLEGSSKIDNCFNSEAVTVNKDDSKSYSGGLVGKVDQGSNVSNSYSKGKLSGKNRGGIVGFDSGGSYENCYFLADGALKSCGNETGGKPSAGESVTEAKMKSGEVAYALQGDSASLIWGQSLSGKNADSFPVLTTANEDKVLKAILVDGGNDNKALGEVYYNYDTKPNFSGLAKNNTTLKIYKDKEMKTELSDKDTFKEDNITFYGKYVCQVTYEVNGGSSVAAVTVDSGSKLTAPANPTRSGYTFDGWYKEKELKNKWDFNKDTVTENITLYAKWTSGSAAGSNNSNNNQAAANNNNPKAGDEGTPVIYYVLFAVALLLIIATSGVLIKRRH